MFKNVCTLLLLFAACSSAFEKDIYLQDGNQNALVDQLIATAKDIIKQKKVEPIHLPDVHEDKIVGPMSFGVTLDQGTLVGLTTLNRAGDAHVTSPDFTTYKLDVLLGLGDIKAHYRVGAHALFIHTGGSVTADAVGVKCHIVASLCFDGSCPTVVQTAKITNVNYKPDINVLPGFNWLANLIAGNFANGSFKAQINTLIENEIKTELKQAIDNLLHH